MLFILVRDKEKGRIVHQEILDPTDTIHEADDPFWEKVAERNRLLEGKYPEAEVIQAVSSSIEAFLNNHPEYGKIVGA